MPNNGAVLATRSAASACEEASTEGLRIFGGLMLVALATGRTAVTNPFALVLLGARIFQSIIHLTSLSSAAVTLRFSAFAVQMVIAVFWSGMLLLG